LAIVILPDYQRLLCQLDIVYNALISQVCFNVPSIEQEDEGVKQPAYSLFAPVLTKIISFQTLNTRQFTGCRVTGIATAP
jgi:hypothetical protein